MNPPLPTLGILTDVTRPSAHDNAEAEFPDTGQYASPEPAPIPATGHLGAGPEDSPTEQQPSDYYASASGTSPAVAARSLAIMLIATNHVESFTCSRRAQRATPSCDIPGRSVSDRSL